MKKLFVVGKAVLSLSFVAFMSSCATQQKMVVTQFDTADTTSPRFTEERSVNAVLQFSSWDYTFLTRPQYLEGGYLQQVHRESLNDVFNRLQVRRGTAVVVVGWTYNGDDLKKLVTDWKGILDGCGFQRVVVLRAQMGNQLNGSVIVDDSSNIHLGAIQNSARGS